MWALAKEAYAQVDRPWRFILGCVLGIVLCSLYPTDLQSYGTARENDLARVSYHDLRFINTAAQVALPLLLRDKIGLVQLVYVGISTTLATHGLKRLLNNSVVWGSRLGERPTGINSQHNMPSGHSSMASCAAYFVCRRYRWTHALYLIPILLLTMYSRVALNQHSVTAVIAGALVGFLMAALFTSHRKV
jgi:membrane-associated phospholipid phosphatase